MTAGSLTSWRSITRRQGRESRIAYRSGASTGQCRICRGAKEVLRQLKEGEKKPITARREGWQVIRKRIEDLAAADSQDARNDRAMEAHKEFIWRQNNATRRRR